MPKPGEPLEPTAISPSGGSAVAATMPSLPPAALLPRGTVVGRYVVEEVLGAGGMGVVYLAHDPELDRRVALKVLHPEGSREETAGDSAGRSRLVREAHAMAKLSHPNVVAIYDAGVYGDDVFLAVERVEGSDMRAWLATPRSWREILDVFLQAGRGLAAAHAAGLVHRDFKPENVLVGKHGEVKVTDFGVAHAVAKEEASGPVSPPSSEVVRDRVLLTPVTQQGEVSGTPAYMAPEQLLGRGGDGRTDEFSFCVALHWALYGQMPFLGPLDPLGENHVRPPPEGSRVPAWVRRALLRGLAIRPDDRYPTLAGLLDRLADDPRARLRRRLPWLAAAALLAGVGAVGGLALRQRAAGDRCRDPAAELAGVWDDAVRARVSAAFAATGAPEAASEAGYAERAMDRVSRVWLAAYGDACQATRVRHAQSETALDLRLDCLDGQRADLRSAVELMLQPDPRNLASAVGAAGMLPLPADCADPRALSVVDQPSPELRPKVDALRARLSRGLALLGATRYDGAIEALEPVAADAAALGVRPLQARALDGLGLAYRRKSDFPKAADLEARAEGVASAAHLDALATRAAAAQAYDLAVLGRPRAEVDAALARAREDLARAGNGPGAEYDVERTEQVVAHVRGEDAEEAAHGRRVMELAEQTFGKESEQTIASANNLAAALEPLGQYDEMAALYRKAIAISDAILGPKSLLPIPALVNLAEALYDLGRPEEAAKVIADLFARLGDRQPPIEAALARALRGAVEVEQGHANEGLRDVEQAYAMGRDKGLLASANFSDIHRYGVEAYLRAGRPKEALARYEKYLAHQDFPPDSPAWIAFLRLGGWAYLDAGEPAEALPILERALRLGTRRPTYPGWMPRLRYQLARALVETGGDRERAAALAQVAHDELATLPAEKALLADVDAWRAKALAAR